MPPLRFQFVPLHAISLTFPSFRANRSAEVKYRVLHNIIGAAIEPKTGNVVTRYGGRVKFAEGSTQLLYNSGQGMPRPGCRYLLFLKSAGEDFDLLTGYELSNGKVTPLDTGTPNFSIYGGADESYLIAEIEKLVLAGPKAS